MPPVVRILSVTLKPSARCRGCDWDTPASSVARGYAKQHARDNRGHEVVVEVVRRDLYQLEEELA